MSDRVYNVFLLPHTIQALKHVTKFRALRLRSLKTGELAGSYEIERHLPLSHFEKYLTDARRHTIIIVHSTDTNEANNLEHGEWVGITHFIGPIPLGEWTWPNIGSLHPDIEETRWHSFGSYVKPDHRRAKPPLMEILGRNARKYAIAQTRQLLGSQAEIENRSSVWMRVRFGVTTSNKKLIDYYKQTRQQGSQMGVAGYVTWEDAVAACENGYELDASEAEKHSAGNREITSCAVVEELVQVHLCPETGSRRGIDAKL